jgi:hypothetical protein
MQIIALCIIVGLLALLLGLMAYLGSHMQGLPGKRVNSAPTTMGGGHEWLRKSRSSYRKKLTRKLQARQKLTQQRRQK